MRVIERVKGGGWGVESVCVCVGGGVLKGDGAPLVLIISRSLPLPPPPVSTADCGGHKPLV